MDFIDLFFLLKEFSLAEMIRFFEKKYGRSEENVFCALKGLIYFADAEKQPMPSLLKSVSWREIKKAIVSRHKEYIKSLR